MRIAQGDTFVNNYLMLIVNYFIFLVFLGHEILRVAQNDRSV